MATAPLRIPGNISDGSLDLVRIDVLASADNDVLDAPGDENPAAGQIAAIPGVEPIAVKQLARPWPRLKIAGGCRGTAELKPPFPPLAERPAGIVDHADLMIGNRLAAATTSIASAVSAADSATPPRLNALRLIRSR